MQFEPPLSGQQDQSKPDQQNSQWQQPQIYPPQQGTMYQQWQQPQQLTYPPQIPPQYPQQQQWQPPMQPFLAQQVIIQQPQIETRVETYKKSKDFQKAAKKLAKQGWVCALFTHLEYYMSLRMTEAHLSLYMGRLLSF